MPTVLATAVLGAGASTFAVNMLGFAISYAISSIFAPDEPEAAAPAKAEGVQARISSNPRNKLPVVYGKARVAGQTVFADISSDNQKMAFIIALSEGDVESITDVYWEDKKLTMSALDATPRNPTDAVDYDNVSHDFLNSNLKISVHPSGGRCSSMEAFSSRWNSDAANRTFPNMAYAYVELTYDRDNGVTGLPSRLYFLINGRTVDTLNTTTKTMSSSSVHSSNPVDCLIDYLTNTRYGASIPLTNIDLDSMSVHKDFCNETLSFTESYCSFPSGDTLNGVAIQGSDYSNEVSCTQQVTDQANFGTWNSAATTSTGKRYETNGVLSTNEDMDKNISHLTIGNGGAFSYNLGKFGLISEGVITQSTRGGAKVHFSEDNIIGRLTLSSAGFDEKLNELTVKFDSIKQKYQEEQVILEIPTGSAIRNVNEPRLERTVRFDMVNNNVQSQRAATVLLNQSRQNLRVSFETDLSNSDLQAGDLIGITHDTPGWGSVCSIPAHGTEVDCTTNGGTWYEGKPFKIQQVTEKTVRVDGQEVLGIGITAKEYSAADYVDSVIQLRDEAPNTKFLDPFTAVGSLSLVANDASEVLNGVPVIKIGLSWTDSAFLRRVEVRYGIGTSVPNPDTNFWTYATSSGTSMELANLQPSSYYQLQIRSVNSVGVTSDWESYDNGSGGTHFETSSLDSIDPIRVEITSSSEANVFSNGTSPDKTLTANVYIGVADTLQDNTAHAGYDYRWYKDSDTSCIDSSGNHVGVADTDVQNTQLACESAGGQWVSGNSVGTQCTSDGINTLFDTNSGDILGCSVAGSSRADSGATNSTHALRTLIVDDGDFTTTASFKCIVSNI